MKLYIMCDFEGACAVVSQAGVPLGTGSLQYDFARKMVTAEVNAAVEGALAGGATDIIVEDAHGGGLNLNYDELNPEVRIVLGTPRIRRMPALDSSFAGLFLIAYHAMAGTTNGILAHSYSSVTIQNMWLNGKKIGEIGLDAALAGALGVPVLLVTSDTAGVQEARSVLGEQIQTVAVKEGLSRNAALSLHPRKAQALIRQAAEIAAKNAGKCQPLVFPAPYRLRREFKLESSADEVQSSKRLNVTRLDDRTVEAVSDDLFDLI